MPLGGLDEEIHGLVRPKLAAGKLHLMPELGTLVAVVSGVELETAAIYSGKKPEAQLRLALLSELERLDSAAQLLRQEGSYRLTYSGGVDGDGLAFPSIL